MGTSRASPQRFTPESPASLLSASLQNAPAGLPATLHTRTPPRTSRGVSQGTRPTNPTWRFTRHTPPTARWPDAPKTPLTSTRTPLLARRPSFPSTNRVPPRPPTALRCPIPADRTLASTCSARFQAKPPSTHPRAPRALLRTLQAESPSARAATPRTSHPLIRTPPSMPAAHATRPLSISPAERFISPSQNRVGSSSRSLAQTSTLRHTPVPTRRIVHRETSYAPSSPSRSE